MVVDTRGLFSVLIANHNNGCFLQGAIKSVLGQTYEHWEIIIVDDKSTDNSLELYKDFVKDSRIKVFYNDENKGCGYTKRRCVELANGEICGFLDPDDELLPRALELMVNTHLANPDKSIVYSRSYYCDSNGIIIGENRLLRLKPGETLFDYRWYGSMHLATFKKKFYDQTVGISAIAKAGVDQDLYFKVEEIGGPIVLNEFTYKYYQRRNPDAITSEKNLSVLWYWNLIVRKDTCIRRDLDVDFIISEDLHYLFRYIYTDGVIEGEKRVRSSKSYLLGKFLLKPISLLKRFIKDL